MRPTRLLVFAFGLAVATPAGAQSATTNDSLVTSMLDMLMDPARWHLSAQGGTNGFGNFLLQQTPAGAVALRGGRGWTVGGGGGFDIDESNSIRLNYAYTGTTMQYRDFRGLGSSLLNVKSIGDLANNAVTLEAQHYFVGSRSLISPYAGFGVAGVWSHLNPTTPAGLDTGFMLTTPGGRQKFGLAPTANVGAQVRLTQEFFARLEWASTAMPNPFNGNRSFQAPNAVTYDQPSRVTKSEWRVAAVYYLGKQPPSQQPTVATSP